MAKGQPIEDYILDPPAVIITNDMQFEEHQARIAFGMSLEQYNALPGTPEWITDDTPFGLSKCHVIAWKRLDNLIGRVLLKASQKS